MKLISYKITGVKRITSMEKHKTYTILQLLSVDEINTEYTSGHLVGTMFGDGTENIGEKLDCVIVGGKLKTVEV